MAAVMAFRFTRSISLNTLTNFGTKGADRSAGPTSAKQFPADLKKSRSEHQEAHDRQLDHAVMNESRLAKAPK